MRCPNCHAYIEEGDHATADDIDNCPHCLHQRWTDDDQYSRSNSVIEITESWRAMCPGCAKMLTVAQTHVLGEEPGDPYISTPDGEEFSGCPGCRTDIDQIVKRGAA